MVTSLLQDLQGKAETVQESLGLLVGEVIQEYDVEFELVALNKNQLYDKGQDIKNIMLKPYKSKYYADMKIDLRGDGKALTDLFRSGEFQRNFHIIVNGEFYEVTSSDGKNSALVEKYGEDIFGFSNDDKPTKTFVIIKPQLQEKVMYGLR